MTTESVEWVVERLDPTRDVDDILDISADAFSRPLTRTDLAAELASSDRSWLFVIRPAATDERPPRVVGYCSAWLIFDELHINTLAVRSEWRQRGAARHLLAFTLDAAARAGATRATLEVRRANTAARHLYEAFGFTVKGVRRDYYANPRDDALILWRETATGA